MILSIFDKCSILEHPIWPSNHTSHTKVYFNEFVENAWPDKIGIVILTSEVMKVVRGQKLGQADKDL